MNFAKDTIMVNALPIYIGTAGWNLRKEHAPLFPEAGSHLARYARRFNAVEINSSFYRDHQAKTYARWAETVSDDFRFAVKLARRHTHENRLQVTCESLRATLTPIFALGAKLGVLLVQLPPSLDFVAGTAERFFASLRDLYVGSLAFEPRHLSWQTPQARALLEAYRISRVVADPAPYPPVGPEPTHGLTYFRFHGSPEMYRSMYTPEVIRRLRDAMAAATEHGDQAWCIFDNTTFGHATQNAAELSAQF